MMSPPAGFARPTGHPATRATQARERGARPGSPANRARAWPRLEIVRSESAEESPQLHRQLARLATPGDDDARMPPTGLEPLAVEAFAVGPVERHEDLVCIAGNVELRLTAGVSYAPWSPARVWLVAAALTPQAVGGEPRSLDERLELGPHHSGVLALEQSPLGEAAVGAYYPTEDAYVFAIAGCRPSAPRDRRRWSARHSGRSPPPARTPSTAR